MSWKRKCKRIKYKIIICGSFIDLWGYNDPAHALLPGGGIVPWELFLFDELISVCDLPPITIPIKSGGGGCGGRWCLQIN